MTGEAPPALVGKVLEIAEDDYLDGRCQVTLCVTAVHNVQIYPSGRWVFLRGTELHTDGTKVRERSALVRLNAILRQVDTGAAPSEAE